MSIYFISTEWNEMMGVKQALKEICYPQKKQQMLEKCYIQGRPPEKMPYNKQLWPSN